MMPELPEFLIRTLDILLGTTLFLATCSIFERKKTKHEEYHWKEMK
jgi:hypothetical protein